VPQNLVQQGSQPQAWTMAVLVATRRVPSEQAKIEPPIIEGRP